MMITLFISKYKKYIYGERYLILSSPALFLLIGSFLSRIKSKWPSLVLGLTLGLFSALSLYQWYFNPQYNRNDWRSLAKYIEQHEKPGDLILINANWNMKPFEYYYQGQNEVRGLPQDIKICEAQDKKEVLITEEKLTSFFKESEKPRRLRLILHSTWISDPQNLVEKWLKDLGYTWQDRISFHGGMEVERFER